jgi:DNA-binding CsgD family transcriptional regulator
LNIFRYFYWGISYSAGISCLFLYISLYIKHRDHLIKHLIIFLLSFILIIISLTIMEYSEKENRLLYDIAGFSANLCTCLLIYALPKYTHAALKVSFSKILNKLFAFTAIILSIFIILSLFINVFNNIDALVMIFLCVSIVYSMMIMIFGKKFKISQYKADLTMKIIAVISLAAMPCFIILDFFYDEIDFIQQFIPEGYYTLPGFYLFLNLMLVMEYFRNLKKDSGGYEIGQDFVDRYCISRREKDVICELIKGKTYKEIGNKLFISMTTVRTHVYSIYQKTKVNNKVELIHLLQKIK